MNESLRILQMLQAMPAPQRAELFSEIQDRYCLICGEEVEEHWVCSKPSQHTGENKGAQP